MEITIDREIFNEAYLPYIFDYNKRYEVFYGGAGSGKSHAVVQKLICKCLIDKRRVLVVRKVARTLRNSCLALFQQILSDWGLTHLYKVNLSSLTLTFTNGSEILMVGCDDVEKIKSIANITDIWCEEATELFADDFSQLDLRLRHPTAKNQQFILSFNPISKANWCYTTFFSTDFETEEELNEILSFRQSCRIIHTTYRDNRFLPEQYIKSLKSLKATNPTYYSIYCEGRFGSLGKLIYTNWRLLGDGETPIGKTAVGLDFGFANDLTALITSYIDDEHKKIYILDEWCENGKVNSEIADAIKDRGLAKTIIIADSAELKSVEEIKREGITRIRPSIKGQGSILQGIQKLQQYELIVSPQCHNTIEELENYQWEKDKKTNEYVNKPMDRWNHCLDALRYSLQAVEINPQLKSMPKQAFGL